MKRILLGLAFCIFNVLNAGCNGFCLPGCSVANQVLIELQNISNQINELGACGLIPIKQADTLISTPGSYCLAEDVNGPVTIASSFVNLNLNGHSITGGLNGILILSDLHDINLFDGIVKNTQNEAVLVREGCSRVRITNVTVDDCAQSNQGFGVDFAGTTTQRIIDCSASHLAISNCPMGLRILNGDSNHIHDINVNGLLSTASSIGISIEGDSLIPAQSNELMTCFVSTVSSTASFARGYSFVHSQNTVATNMQATNIVGTSFVCGLYSESGIGNSWSDCQILDIESFDIGFIGAIGIFLSAEQDYSLTGCKVKGLQAQTNSSGCAALGTQNGVLTNSSIDNIYVSGKSQSAVGFACAMSSQALLCSNLTARNIQAASGQARGFGLFNMSSNVSIENCTMQNIRAAGGAAGFHMTGASNVSITNSVALDVLDLVDDAFGFALLNSSSCNIKSCHSGGIQSGLGKAVGYYASNTNRCSFVECESQNVLSSDATAYGFDAEFCTAFSYISCISQANDVHNGTSEASGFKGANSTDLLYDMCLTQSNSSLNGRGSGFGNGFDIESTANVQIIECIGSMNDGTAYILDALSNACLVQGCLGTYSAQGFTDLAMTNTFIQNTAAFNGTPISLTNNYSGIPLSWISSIGDPTLIGSNISA